MKCAAKPFAFCLTAWPALFAALLVWATPAAAQDAAFTFATWNIAWLGDGKNDHVLKGNKEYPRKDEDYKRLAGYAKQLQADVIALQEMENADAVARVFPRKRWNIFVSGRKTSPKWAQRTALVVRKGIEAKRLRDVALSDSNRLRYGVDVELVLNGRKVRVLSVHLKTGCYSWSLNTSTPACWALVQQVPYLKAWIDKRLAEGTPFVVAGDWNRHLATPGDEMWRALRENGGGSGSNSRLTLVGASEKPKCLGGRYKAFVDHIVLGGEATDWLAPNGFRELVYAEQGSAFRAPSDHCPVAAKLQPR